MKAVVKKWIREKGYGFLDNGTGPDVAVRKADLVNCQYLKVGSTVEFECHPDNRGLIAKKVRLTRQRNEKQQPNGNRSARNHPFGVMT